MRKDIKLAIESLGRKGAWKVTDEDNEDLVDHLEFCERDGRLMCQCLGIGSWGNISFLDGVGIPVLQVWGRSEHAKPVWTKRDSLAV